MNKNFNLKITELLNNNNFYELETKIKLHLKKENNLFAKNILAVALVKQNKIKKAIIAFKEIIKNNSNFLDAYYNIILALNLLNKSSEAKNYAKKAISKCKSVAEKLKFQNLHAQIYAKENDLKNVHIIFKEILHKDPKNIEAILNYSGFLIKNEFFIDAKLLLGKAITFYHNIPGIWTNLGILYYEENNFLKSIECDKNSIKIDPQNYIPYYNIGRSYYQLGKYKKSIQYFEKSLKVNSKHSKSYFNLGLAFDKIGAIDLAVKNFLITSKLMPEFKEARFNLGRCYLAVDDFKNGWSEYEFRLQVEKLGHKVKNIKKMWDGKKISGSLLVHSEQGIGDQVLFSTILEDLYKLNSKIVVILDRRLISLYKRSFPKINFLQNNKADLVKWKGTYTFLGSLGKYFRNSSSDFLQNKKKLLKALPKNINKFKLKIKHKSKINVGLHWKSFSLSPDNKGGHKNISLESLSRILPSENYDLYSLQYGDKDKDIKDLYKNTKREIIIFNDLDYKNDLEKIAGLISNFDFIISNYTFLAFFAGSLGVPTFVFVPLSVTWPLHSHSLREKSLWFPSMSLIKQKKLHNWDDAYKELKIKISSNNQKILKK